MGYLTNLKAAWEFEESAGASAIDAVNAYNLTDHNTVARVAAKVANGADFEAGSSHWLGVADNADLSAGDRDFTFAVWAKFESIASSMTLASKWGASGQQEWAFWLNGSNFLQLLVSHDGTTLTTSAGAFAPTTATWYFCVFWHDATGNTINVQVNDGTADSVSHTTGVFNGTAAFEIGGLQGGTGGFFFDGILDQAMWWTRLLTGGEKTFLYNSGAGRSYADLVAADGGGGGSAWGGLLSRRANRLVFVP